MSISYPDLEPSFAVVPVPMANEEASAPVDAELQRIHINYNTTCAACKGTDVSEPGAAYAVLYCQHQVHITCLLKFPALGKSGNRIGGVHVCEHCADIAMRSGTGLSETDPDLDLRRCAEEMCEKHKKQTHIDTEAIVRAGVSNEIVFAITGATPPTPTRKFPSVAALYSLFKPTAAPTTDDDGDELIDEVSEFASRLPRGDALVEYLGNQKPPRTLEMILNSLKINLAHLTTVGINNMEQLKKIGFDVRKHLDPNYRAVLPVYMLAQVFGMSYDEHMRDVVSPKELAEMKLTKRELRLLGVTATKLIGTKKCSKDVLLQLHIAPSQQIKYLGLELAHLKILGFSAADFDREPLWKAEKAKNAQIRELVAQLATDQKKK
jgi:hypothetical protein